MEQYTSSETDMLFNIKTSSYYKIPPPRKFHQNIQMVWIGWQTSLDPEGLLHLLLQC